MKKPTSAASQKSVEALRGWLRGSGLTAGMLLPPEVDLCVALDISRGTLRRAIEVLTETGEIQRRPHFRAIIGREPAPSRHRGSDVHVWVSHPIADEATLRFIRGISKSLMGTPCRLVVREPSRCLREVIRSDERDFLKAVLESGTAAGAIIQRDAYGQNEDLFQELIDNEVPLVFVDTPAPEGIVADQVGTANAAAVRQSVDHLIELGHQRIVCVVDSEASPTMRDRIAGYWRAMQFAGLQRHGRCIVADQLKPVSGPLPPLGGSFAGVLAQNSLFYGQAQAACREIMAMDPMPTAIFAGHDTFAFWISGILEGAGMRLPGDFALVGFDWLARWDRSIPDTLTTAAQDFEGFGSQAADLLLEHFYTAGRREPKSVFLPAPLVIRSSTKSDISMPELLPASTHGKVALS